MARAPLRLKTISLGHLRYADRSLRVETVLIWRLGFDMVRAEVEGRDVERVASITKAWKRKGRSDEGFRLLRVSAAAETGVGSGAPTSRDRLSLPVIGNC
jgi:hypothetical protein